MYSTNLFVGSIPAIVGGSTAYVGFTGAYGGSTAVQTINNFSFESLASETIQVMGTNVLVSWPGLVTGYVCCSRMPTSRPPTG